MHPSRRRVLGRRATGARPSSRVGAEVTLRGLDVLHIYARLSSSRPANLEKPHNTERAVLAGGCFWGMQDLIRRKPGVISTRAAIQAARSSTAIMPATARATTSAPATGRRFFTPARNSAGRLRHHRRRRGLWPGKVVTELSPVCDFWQAEPEHQDYLERYLDGYTCHFARPGSKLPRRKVG
jgi:peptide-methionine (S)-S-oxide reductase